MNPDDSRQRLAHEGCDDGADTGDGVDGAAPASPYAPASVDDVSAAVRAAVAAFVPPPGFEDFPMPTKNNLQRSLIYYFGRRVQSTATGKSQWFCLASPQCRANKTTISTTANISGCTRHLQVFHQLISPKTVLLNRKSLSSSAAATAATSAPAVPAVPAVRAPEQQSLLPHDDAAPPQRSFLSSSQQQQQPRSTAPTTDTSVSSSARVSEQLQSAPAAPPAASSSATVYSPAPERKEAPQRSPRERALEWTRTAVVRHLLPLALASDDDLLQLARPSASSAAATGTLLSEKAVQHHLIELYAAAQQRMTTALARELALAALPTLHLALVAVPSSSQVCSSHRLDAAACERFVALHISYVSSRFVREQHVVAVARCADPLAREHVPPLTRWLKRVLERVGIATKHVRSFVVDHALGDAASLYEDAATALLGRACERSVSAALATTGNAVSGDDDDDSQLEQLVHSVYDFVKTACAADFVACFHGLERHVLALLALEPTLPSTPLSQVPWQALVLVLDRIVRSWDACQAFFREKQHTGAAMPVLLETFTRDDLAQCGAIVRPVADFVRDVSSPTSECAEAVIRLFAVQQTGLNAARALHVPVYDARDAACTSDTDSDDNGGNGKQQRHEEDSSSSDSEEDDAMLEHRELTAFAQRFREELAKSWSARVAEQTTAPSLTALTCVFFHPCFRQLSFLDAAAKTRLHAHIQALARDVLDWRSAAATGDDQRDSRSGADSADAAPVKKRRLSRHEKLTRQAQELSRLGFLDGGAASHATTPERSARGSSQQRTADRAAADLAVARELERYVQNEAVAFCDVPFDKMLPYWQHKAFDYPTLALVAQAALGHPAALTARLGAARAGDDATAAGAAAPCVRCVFGGRSSLPWPAGVRSETKALEELTLVLHYSDLSTLPVPRELSDQSAAQVIAALVREREG